MLNNNLLENRLNEYKNKSNSIDENIVSSNKNFKINEILYLFSAFLVMFRAIVYGYSLKLVFSTDWKWWQFCAIGIALNFFLTYLYDLIHNKQ